MSKHLTGVMVAVLAAAMLYPAPALADHRPGNVVVMGVTSSFTGRYIEPAGRIHNGQKLYVEELNARGGLLGHKIELKIYDDKSDKRTAIELYQKLITEDKVDLLLGPYSSYLNDAVANVMERYKQPYVAQGSNPVIYERGRRYVFRNVMPITRDLQKGVQHLAKKIGVTRIAIISRTDVAGRGGEFLGAQEWAKKLGLDIVLQERYRKEQTDFAGLLRRIEATGAEAIFAVSRFRDSVALIRQLRELNVKMKMFYAAVGPALPKFVKELGSTAEYVMGFSMWEPNPVLGHPGIKEFIENYERRFGVTPNYHASGGYSAMQIFVAAVKRAGSFDPEKIRDALTSILVYTIRGPYKANEHGFSTPIEALTFQIQNGKRVILWPEHMAEGKFLPMPKWEERAKK